MRSIYKNILILFVLFFCIPSFHLSANPYLFNLATNIIRVKSEKRDDARKKLLQEFKNIRSLDARTLSHIIHTYHYGLGETLLFPQYQQSLERAVDRFYNRDGFVPKIYALLSNIKEEKFVKGHMYEIEVALHIDTPRNLVTHFGYQFMCERDDVKQRDIDLATSTGVIECKNIDWSVLDLITNEHPVIQKIQSQLLSYKHYTESYKPPLPFTLYSKMKINDQWKEWLNGNDIPYIEYDPSITSPESPKEINLAK